jgi:hypothetical protein
MRKQYFPNSLPSQVRAAVFAKLCRFRSSLKTSLKVAYLPVTADTVDKSSNKRFSLSWRLQACRQVQ